MEKPQVAVTAKRKPRLFDGRRDASQSAWPAVAAWGAALIQLALGAGAITAPDGFGAAGAAGAWAVGLPLIALGLAGLVWGGLTLARGRVVAPRAAVAGVLAGLVGGVVGTGRDPVRTSVTAVGAATLLLVVGRLRLRARAAGG